MANKTKTNSKESKKVEVSTSPVSSKSTKSKTSKEWTEWKGSKTTSKADKAIMEDILVNLKGCCNLFVNATIESSTPKVHSSFETALSDALKMQNETYTNMSNRGWYQAKQVPVTKIAQTRKKTSSEASV